jgi:hypothetical protein
VNQELDTETKKSKTGLDGIKWGMFDRERIVCGWDFDERYRSSCYMYKQFINPADKASNWSERLQALNRFGFIDDDTLRMHEHLAQI